MMNHRKQCCNPILTGVICKINGTLGLCKKFQEKAAV